MPQSYFQAITDQRFFVTFCYLLRYSLGYQKIYKKSYATETQHRCTSITNNGYQNRVPHPPPSMSSTIFLVPSRRAAVRLNTGAAKRNFHHQICPSAAAVLGGDPPPVCLAKLVHDR